MPFKTPPAHPERNEEIETGNENPEENRRRILFGRKTLEEIGVKSADEKLAAAKTLEKAAAAFDHLLAKELPIGTSGKEKIPVSEIIQKVNLFDQQVRRDSEQAKERIPGKELREKITDFAGMFIPDVGSLRQETLRIAFEQYGIKDSDALHGKIEGPYAAIDAVRGEIEKCEDWDTLAQTLEKLGGSNGIAELHAAAILAEKDAIEKKLIRKYTLKETTYESKEFKKELRSLCKVFAPENDKADCKIKIEELILKDLRVIATTPGYAQVAESSRGSLRRKFEE